MPIYKKIGDFDKRAKRKATHEKAKKQFDRAKDFGKLAQGIDSVMNPFRGLGFTKKQRQAKKISKN